MFENTFEYKFKIAEKWQKQRYSRLVENFNGIELTDEDKRYLLWISGFDSDTERVISNLFNKIKNK